MQVEWDINCYTVTYAGETIHFLPKEYVLFRFLFEHKNQSFTREELLNRVWSLEEPSDRTVDDHIYRLRKKLKKWEALLEIETIRGRGYRLVTKKTQAIYGPELQKQALTEDIKKLMEKYHSFGMGNAMQALANNKDILGIELTRHYAVYLHFVTGNFNYFLDTSELLVEEKIFYLLHIYWATEKDVNKTLLYFEKALKLKDMSSKLYNELPSNMIMLYLFTNQINQAKTLLDESKEQIMDSENREDYLLYYHTKEIYLYFICGNQNKVQEACDNIEQLLLCYPHLRERGLYTIIKGLLAVDRGKKKEGHKLIYEGMEILKQSKFVPHYIQGVWTIQYFLTHQIKDTELSLAMQKQWDQISNEYDFPYLQKRIEAIFKTYL